MSSGEHENVKEWVLAVSMDQKVEQQLPLDERMTYEASLVAGKTGTVSPACIISGYPVIGSKYDQAFTLYLCSTNAAGRMDVW